MAKELWAPLPFHPARPSLVAPARVDPTGLTGPTSAQTRGRRCRTTGYGLYLPASVSREPVEQRIVEAGVLLPAYGGVSGWAGLRWCGGRWFDGLGPDGATELPVTLAIADSTIRAKPGIEISEERLDPREIIEVDGLRVTVAVRSVCFLMRYARSERLAAEILSMAAYSDLVSIDEMRGYAATRNGWTGIPRCRKGTELADENCWSPREAGMLQNWVLDAELPRPLCNVPVFDRAGQHIGTPDLLDPVAGVIAEYDGAVHLAGSRRASDVRREDKFRSHGLQVVTMTSADLRDTSEFLGRLLRAHSRAEGLGEGRRSWTLEKPDWWVPTSTVAQRRALTGEQRARWLKYRAA
jgi:hypothetical protein